MKKLFLFIICIPSFLFSQSSDFIHIDQFGYKKNHTKIAVISNPQTGYNASDSYTAGTTLEVKDASSNVTVFSGNPISWNNGLEQEQSGDIGWWFDFSSITQDGDYYIYDPTNDERSAIFTISDAIYTNLLITASKVFYYNRCGIAKVTPYVLNGYIDATSFTQDNASRDVYDQNNPATEKDMSGGWFDAGDYNKYVTFAAGPVHDLLWAYQENPSVFEDNWNIPESGNNIPDVIDEVKWEIDWLLKMINSDGSVHIKIGSRNHSENGNSPPSANTDLRYYAPTCTSSAIAASSMLAHASKVFSQFSSLNSYSQILETKAEETWEWVLPYIENNSLEENCDDGSVISGDADQNIDEQKKNALSSAIYLFDLTSNSTYGQYIINHINDSDVINNGQWNNYNIKSIDALLHYTTLTNADTTTINTILNSANTAATNNWNNYFEFSDNDLYRSYINDWVYHWGSNSQKSSFGVLNLLFYKHQINNSSTSTFKLRAKEQIHYFHGVNPLGLVYLSNMNNYGAEKSINQIYHTWFADGTIWDDVQTSTYGPAPGYVSGGANGNYEANTSLIPPYNQPLMKSYLDFNTGWPDNSWEITEPAIYYQSSYIRLLSNIINMNFDDDSLSTIDNEIATKTYTLKSNPFEDSFSIISSATENVKISIVDINGRIIVEPKMVSTNKAIGFKSYSNGLYFLRIENNYGSTVLKIIKN